MDKRHHRHLISLSISTILPYFAHTIIIRYEVCNFLTAGVLIFKGEEKCLMYYKIDFTTFCFPFLNFEICLSDHHRNTFKKLSRTHDIPGDPKRFGQEFSKRSQNLTTGEKKIVKVCLHSI